MRRRGAAPLLLAAVLALAWALRAARGQATARRLGVTGTCGSGMAIEVACLIDAATQRIVDVRWDDSNGGTWAVCSNSGRGLTEKRFRLPPGDAIYGLRACYVNSWLVGVVFSSVGGSLVCGNPDTSTANCQSVLTRQPEPLAWLWGTCSSARAVTGLTQVCFNPNYVNPIIPIDGCPPGQGRDAPGEPCQPCPLNYYNPGGLQGQCVQCPNGLVTVTTGATNCGCPPGYGANPNSQGAQPCVLCKPGFYSPGGNVQPCWRCRGSPYLTSPTGAASIVQCVCRPGFGVSIMAPQSCQVCPKGTWSNSLNGLVPHDPSNSLVSVPPGVGKGKGKGGIPAFNPSYKECTPCCEDSSKPCNLTTLRPGAQSADACVPECRTPGCYTTPTCNAPQTACAGRCCSTLGVPASNACLVSGSTGTEVCCPIQAVCESSGDGFRDCCTGGNATTPLYCMQATSSAGALLRRCCQAGYVLCPNASPPVCAASLSACSAAG